MNKKTAATIAALNAEIDTLNARMVEIDAAVEAGACADDFDEEYNVAQRRVREIGYLIHEANQPKRRICPNTAALVAANID